MNKADYAELRREVVNGISALRDDGQDARAHGATKFLESSHEYGNYSEDSVGFTKAVWLLEGARSWVQGGLRAGDNVTALGARTEYRYEIRNPQGDLELATNDIQDVNDWIEVPDLQVLLNQYDERAPDYVVIDHRDDSITRAGYIDASMRIQALRDAGQFGRADGAQMFLDGAQKVWQDGIGAAIREKLENSGFAAALYWIEGGERIGDDVIMLGRSSGKAFEVRDPYGDLVLASDDHLEITDWIKEYCDQRMNWSDFEGDKPGYTVFNRHDNSHNSAGYIH